MKIEVLGSGNLDSVHPSASAIVDNKILVDIPTGIVKELIKNEHNIADIEVCLITHYHADHYFDLPSLLLKKADSIRKDSAKDAFLVIVGPADIENRVKDLAHLAYGTFADKVFEKLKIKYIECEDFAEIIVAKNIIITSIKMNHTDDLESYGFIVEDGKNKVGFTGDTKMCDGVQEIAKNCETLFIDTTYDDSEGKDAHMGINDLEKIADANENLKVVTTHMLDTTREKVKKRLDTRKELKEKNRMNLNENITIGEEGLIIEL